MLASSVPKASGKGQKLEVPIFILDLQHVQKTIDETGTITRLYPLTCY